METGNKGSLEINSSPKVASSTVSESVNVSPEGSNKPKVSAPNVTFTNSGVTPNKEDSNIKSRPRINSGRLSAKKVIKNSTSLSNSETLKKVYAAESCSLKQFLGVNAVTSYPNSKGYQRNLLEEISVDEEVSLHLNRDKLNPQSKYPAKVFDVQAVANSITASKVSDLLSPKSHKLPAAKKSIKLKRKTTPKQILMGDQSEKHAT